MYLIFFLTYASICNYNNILERKGVIIMMGEIQIIKIISFFDQQTKITRNRIDYILNGKNSFKCNNCYVGREILSTITNKNILEAIPRKYIEKQKIVDCEFEFEKSQLLLRRIYINEKSINLL